jgi:hypothetical protein
MLEWYTRSSRCPLDCEQPAVKAVDECVDLAAAALERHDCGDIIHSEAGLYIDSGRHARPEFHGVARASASEVSGRVRSKA